MKFAEEDSEEEAEEEEGVESAAAATTTSMGLRRGCLLLASPATRATILEL